MIWVSEILSKESISEGRGLKPRKNFIRAILFFPLAFILIYASPVRAEDPPPISCNDDKGVFNIIAENDLWGNGKDQHFTHGTRFSYATPNISGRCQEEDPGLWEKARGVVQDLVPKVLELEKSRFSFVLGQSIFTPEDITTPSLILNDRPYAGWLYIGFGFLAERPGVFGGDAFDTFEADIGVVGPASLAEYIQEGWHDVIDTTDPEGWGNQLKNEPGFLLTYERKWRLYKSDQEAGGLQFDFMPHAGVALGNVFTYGAVGATARVGMHLQADYGAPRIRPGVQGSDFFDRPKGAFGWYLFAGVEGRAVGRNVFLDGNTFENSHSVGKKTFVGDLQVGLVVTFREFRLAFTNIFRTDEFSGQNEADEFGAISASFRF